MQLTNEELKIANKRYRHHVSRCKRRVDKLGNQIEMRLTFEEWLDIWLSSGQYHNMGKGAGQYVMARNNDIGHYEIDNVKIKTAKENSIENNNSLEWRKNNKTVLQNKSAEWKANNKAAMPKRSANPLYREKLKDARAKLGQNKEWCEKNTLATQKSNSKQVSCDGVIYDSLVIASTHLAPSNLKYKPDWLRGQMKKYPDRYFYI